MKRLLSIFLVGIMFCLFASPASAHQNPQGCNTTNNAIILRFYSESAFNGQSLDLCTSVSDLANIPFPGGGNWSNKITSYYTLHGSQNTTYRLYESAGYTGASINWGSGLFSPMPSWNNRVSSVKYTRCVSSVCYTL